MGYPLTLCIIILSQDIVATLGHRHGDTEHCTLRPGAALIIRLALFAILLSLSYMVCVLDTSCSSFIIHAQAYDSLAGFISLLGGVCSMCCSVILPCLCYLMLGSARGSVLMQVAVVAMMAIGVAVLFAVLLANLYH